MYFVKILSDYFFIELNTMFICASRILATNFTIIAESDSHWNCFFCFYASGKFALIGCSNVFC